jgi:hypothetical protein
MVEASSIIRETNQLMMVCGLIINSMDWEFSTTKIRNVSKVSSISMTLTKYKTIGVNIKVLIYKLRLVLL